jgi:hypothetical protein
MSALQTFFIALATTFFMATFTSVANFMVNRYMPRIAEHVEKKVKKEK